MRPPADMLFIDGAELPAYSRLDRGRVDGPDHSMLSPEWRFLPPPGITEAIVARGSFTLTAVQGSAVATDVVDVRSPRAADPEATIVKQAHAATEYVLEVEGAPPGSEQPIGLYREFDRWSGKPKAQLVAQLGRVRIPASGVGQFPIPDSDLDRAGIGSYCVLPPAKDSTVCAWVANWPTYPGPVRAGEGSDVVRAWQNVLTVAGILDDVPSSHDGYYGSTMQAAVNEYLSGRGEGPAFKLDRDIYQLISGG